MKKIKSNPRVLILLSSLVISVWGGVIYKMVKYEKLIKVEPKVKIVKSKRQEKNMNDVPVLLLSYNDPFNVTTRSIRHGRKKIDNAESLPVRNKRSTEHLKGVHDRIEGPTDHQKEVSIKYTGMFNNTSSNEKVAIIKVDDNKIMVCEGQIFKNGRVKSIGQDSVVVELNGVIKVIRK